MAAARTRGGSFGENARQKAEAVFLALGEAVAVLADDSGLEVEALGGLPGVRSARFAGEGATDQENVDKLLHELGERRDRAARFVHERVRHEKHDHIVRCHLLPIQIICKRYISPGFIVGYIARLIITQVTF